MPSTTNEGSIFWRWLTSLWKKAESSIDAGQSVSLNSSSGYQSLLQHSQPQPTPQTWPPPAPVRQIPQDLNALMLSAIARPPLLPAGITAGTDVIVDIHAKRRSTGTVDVNGTAVLWISGQKFFADMEGRHFVINGTIYTVDTFVDDENLILTADAGIYSAAPFVYQQYYPWQYPKGTLYFETDRQLLYVVSDATCYVDTLDAAFGMTSGPEPNLSFMNPEWKGLSIKINGIFCIIDEITSLTTGTATVFLGAQLSVPCEMPNGAWKYVSGTYMLPLIADMPKDLWLDDRGALVEVFDYSHLYVWIGTSWTYAPGDPGSGWYAVLGNAPQGGRWAAANGTFYWCSREDGTITTIYAMDLQSDAFIVGASANGIVQAATPANWQNLAATDTEVGHQHTIPSQADHTHGLTNTAAASGSGATAPPATTDAGGIHDHGGATTFLDSHSHYLGAAAELKAPSETNGGLPKRISVTWYMRL